MKMASVSVINILKYSSLNRIILRPERVFTTRSLPALTSSCVPQQQRQFSSSANPAHKVLFDGKCPLCVREVDFLKTFNRGSVDFVDISDGTYNPDDHLGIKLEDAMGALHVISPNNEVFVAMEGSRELYRAAGLGWMMAWTDLPGVRGVADSAYRWFALNRHWLTGRLGESKLDDCDSGRCKINKDGQQKRG